MSEGGCEGIAVVSAVNGHRHQGAGLGLKKIYALKKIIREIALRKPDLTIPVRVTKEMETEARELAMEAEEVTKRKRVSDIFEKDINERVAGYLGQFAFHQFQSGKWRNAITYIRAELKQIEQGEEIESADAEIDGRGIDIKTTDFRRGFLAYQPSPFGLLVPEKQASHIIHDFYVFVLLVPPDIAEKYGDCQAVIYGYAYGEEVEKTKAKHFERHRTLNRQRYFLDLHPIRFLKSGIWNSEEARHTTLRDEF